MTIDNLALPMTVPPMLAQHAQDAAFYWMLRDTSETSPHLTLEKLTHIETMLTAHLDGLLIAGSAGMSPAEAALARWRSAGEMFVCFYLAASGHQHSSAEKLLAQAAKRADTLLRGLISAIASLPTTLARQWIPHCSASSVPALQVAALRACALLGAPALDALATPLASLITSSNEHVRAAGCRALGVARDDAPALLQTALTDEHLCVRAEASIALARLGQPQAMELWRCVSSQALIHDQASGWHRKQAERRLLRWTRHLACQVTHGHPQIMQLLARLPARVSLCFVLHHADPQYLGFVLHHLDDPDNRRYAAWVWQCMTGNDLTANGLTLAESPPAQSGSINQDQIDFDNGMLLPNAAAIRAFPARYPSQGKLLQGQSLTTAFALSVLENAAQAVRAIAATHLTYAYPAYPILLRGSVQQQMQAIRALRLHGANLTA